MHILLILLIILYVMTVVGVKRRGSVKEECWRAFDNAAWYKERTLGADVSDCFVLKSY